MNDSATKKFHRQLPQRSKNAIFNLKKKNRKIKQVLMGFGTKWKGRAHEERVKEGKYGGSTLHSHVKMEK
jgi:hypothetical protein